MDTNQPKSPKNFLEINFFPKFTSFFFKIFDFFFKIFDHLFSKVSILFSKFSLFFFKIFNYFLKIFRFFFQNFRLFCSKFSIFSWKILDFCSKVSIIFKPIDFFVKRFDCFQKLCFFFGILYFSRNVLFFVLIFCLKMQSFCTLWAENVLFPTFSLISHKCPSFLNLLKASNNLSACLSDWKEVEVRPIVAVEEQWIKSEFVRTDNDKAIGGIRKNCVSRIP